MKTTWNFVPILSGVCALALAGCESTSFSERLASIPPQVLTVAGDAETVNLAAQKAFKRLDFVIVRSRAGRIEAASAIKTSETFGDSRQTVARVRITEPEPGKCVVELMVTEEVGSASMGGTHRRDFREHSLFGTYFAMLQQVLQEMTAEQAAQKD